MAAMTSTHEHLADCPACKKPITADVSSETRRQTRTAIPGRSLA